MIIIRLKGGLGNQMFQYAFGLKLAEELNTKMKLDLSALLDRSKGDFVYRNYDLPIFDIKDEFLISPTFLKAFYTIKSSKLSKLLRKRINGSRNYIREKHFHFQAQLVEEPLENTIYEGWFQSPKYFEGVEEKLRQHFTFKDKILDKSQELFREIQSTNSICLNVRRTDFLKVHNLNTTSEEYFQTAAIELAERVDNAHFFIFSDDISWCRENIKLKYPSKFVDHGHKGFKFSNYMQLMSACKHFIIPNSSFAWWAVWLNKNENRIVVAPKNWFNDPAIDTTDLVPKNWLRV